MISMRKISEETLTASKITRLKWATTVAVIGIPVTVQILGAMIYFGQDIPVLLHPLAIVALGILFLFVSGSGIYALSHQVFLHFMTQGKSLSEWDGQTRDKAFAFAYRIVVKGLILGLIGFSLLGALQLLNVMDVIKFEFAQSLTLNLPGMAAFVISLAYLVLLLPTLYMAWTLKPLPLED